MARSGFFKNDFPRIWYLVLGIVLGTSALFNPASQPVWVALKVTLVVLCFGFALANLIGLLLRRRRPSRTNEPD